MAMFWIEVPTAIVFVALRMYSRFKLRNTGLDDWLMVITLVSKSTCTPHFANVNDLLAFTYGDCCGFNLSHIPWRTTSSLLLEPYSEGVREQVKLDFAAIQHHISRHGQDVGRLSTSTTSRPLRFLAQMVSLYHYSIDLPLRQLDRHLHICSMRPSASVVGRNGECPRCQMLES